MGVPVSFYFFFVLLMLALRDYIKSLSRCKLLSGLLMIYLLWTLSLSFSFAQLGPGLGSPTVFSMETLQGRPRSADTGVEKQFDATLSVPLWKTEDVIVTSSLNYQNLSLFGAPFAVVTKTGFESATVNLQGIIHPGNRDGWLLGATFGSASDKIFANSDVFTYNLNVQRRNQLSGQRAFLYGFFYSNNAAILPGLPIPTLAYEIQNNDSGDFVRIGFPLVVRQHFNPETKWGLFAIGPIIWDLYLKNTTLTDYHFTLGVQKRPDTYLLSEPIPGSPLSQLMIEQTSLYGQVELKHWAMVTLGLKAAYHFNNRFRLRETGTTRDDFDQKQPIQDYAFVGLNFKLHARAKPRAQ